MGLEPPDRQNGQAVQSAESNTLRGEGHSYHRIATGWGIALR